MCVCVCVRVRVWGLYVRDVQRVSWQTVPSVLLLMCCKNYASIARTPLVIHTGPSGCVLLRAGNGAIAGQEKRTTRTSMGPNNQINK